jgi:hypothetical protein
MRQHIVDMVGGRGTLRFFVQPALAVVIGVNRARISLLYGLVYAAVFVATPYFIARALANRIAGA